MKKLFLIVFLVAFMMTGANVGQLMAEDAETFYTFGTVKSSSDGIITIEEVTYDGETDEEIVEEVVYVLTTDTKVENADSIGDIEPGSEIDLEYVEEGGAKKAAYIYVYDEQFVD